MLGRDMFLHIISFFPPFLLFIYQGWNSDFGLDKERKKDSRQGKKTPGKDLTKARKPLSRQNLTKKCVNLWENAQYKTA